MLKPIIILITILFSSGAVAAVCSVYLPPGCKEVVGSDISFHQAVIDGTSMNNLVLDVEVNCTINLEAEHVDNLTVGDIFHNHRKYKVSFYPVNGRNNRLEDYIIDFHRYKTEDDMAKLPYVVCNFE